MASLLNISKHFCKALRYDERDICPPELRKPFFHTILMVTVGSIVEPFLATQVGLPELSFSFSKYFHDLGKSLSFPDPLQL